MALAGMYLKYVKKKAPLHGHSNSNSSFGSRLLLITLVDLLAASCCTTGLLMVGSGLFSIIYASTSAWTAVIGRVLLKRTMHVLRWVGVCVVTAGLVLYGWETGAGKSEGAVGIEGGGGDETLKIQVGSATLLFGTMLHSLMVVSSSPSSLTSLPHSPPITEQYILVCFV